MEQTSLPRRLFRQAMFSAKSFFTKPAKLDKSAIYAPGIGKWLDTPTNGKVLCASRAGKPGTVAQDKRRAQRKRRAK